MSKEIFFTPYSMVTGKTGKSRTYTDAAGQKYFQMIKDPQLIVNQQVEVIAEESDYKGKTLTWIKLKPSATPPPVKPPTTLPLQTNGNGVVKVLQNEQQMWADKERREIRTRIHNTIFMTLFKEQLSETNLDKIADEIDKYAERGFAFVYRKDEEIKK